MQTLNISEFLYSTDKIQQDYPIKFTISNIDTFKITEPIIGRITIYKTNSKDITAKFNLKTQTELECQRCLNKFTKQIILQFSQQYSRNPKEDNLRISPNSTIEILEPIKQEFIVNLPYKILCQQNCAGLCPKCGQNLNSDKKHQH